MIMVLRQPPQPPHNRHTTSAQPPHRASHQRPPTPQATRRVAAVLGPPCNGTGLCQQLLQLGIGLLLRELLDGLRAAAAAAEARLQAAAAAGAAAAGARLQAAAAGAGAAAEQGFPGAAPEGGAAVGVAPVAMLDLYSGHDSTLMPLLAGGWVRWEGGEGREGGVGGVSLGL